MYCKAKGHVLHGRMCPFAWLYGMYRNGICQPFAHSFAQTAYESVPR